MDFVKEVLDLLDDVFSYIGDQDIARYASGEEGDPLTEEAELVEELSLRRDELVRRYCTYGPEGS